MLGVGGVDPEQIAGTVCGEGERKIIGAGLRTVSRVIRIRGGIGRYSARRQVDDKCFAAADLIFTYFFFPVKVPDSCGSDCPLYTF